MILQMFLAAVLVRQLLLISLFQLSELDIYFAVAGIIFLLGLVIYFSLSLQSELDIYFAIPGIIFLLGLVSYFLTTMLICGFPSHRICKMMQKKREKKFEISTN